jgi:hypothetical protein
MTFKLVPQRRYKPMRTLALVGILAASTCWAQEPASNPEPPPAQVVATQAPAASQSQTLTIPVRTRIPVALANPISSKSRRGDSVRAITGFPVTAGTQLAIPAGTYVEGVIDKVTRGGRSGPSLQMHFTRILFPNGYSVAVDGTNAQANARTPDSNSAERAAFASENQSGSQPSERRSSFTSENESGPNYAGTEFASEAESNSGLGAQQQPTLPPLKQVGPNIGTVVGITLGATVALVVTLVVLGRHHGGTTAVLFDTGWQFELVLQSPLSLDAASVAAASAAPSAQ